MSTLRAEFLEIITELPDEDVIVLLGYAQRRRTNLRIIRSERSHRMPLTQPPTISLSDALVAGDDIEIEFPRDKSLGKIANLSD